MRTSLSVIGLQTYGYHGLIDEERSLGQKFRFDVRAELESAQTHLGDNLGSSVRYDALIEEVVKIASKSKFRTLEALAEAIARGLIEHFERIRIVTVVVSKVSPPIPQSTERVSVEVCLER